MRAAEPGAVQDVELPLDFSSIEGAARIAVAVSGGSDSLALLMLTKDWARGQTVTAVTFDHGLRPESFDEAQWVGAVCRRLGIAHVILSAHSAPQSGIQAWARQARYDALTAWCFQNDHGILLTGHTLNDQAETVAMRRMRTDSRASLAGIWPNLLWNGVQIVRPLLGARRGQLRQFLERMGQDWLEDPSNDNPQFERVRVRQALGETEIAPLGAVAAGHQTAVSDLLVQACDWRELHVASHSEGYFSISRDSIAAVGDDLLATIIDGLTLALTRQRPKTSNARNRLTQWVRSTGSSRTTLCGVIICRRAKDVLFAREFGRISTDQVIIPPSGQVLWDNRFMVTAAPGGHIRARGMRLKADRKRGVPAFVCDTTPCVVDEFGQPLGFSAIFCPHVQFS